MNQRLGLYSLFIASILFSACALPPIQHKRGANPDIAVAHYQQNVGPAKECVQHVLDTQKNLKGMVTLEWTVNDQGKVVDSGIKERTLNSVEIEQCLLTHVRSMTFPPTPFNSTATIDYTYNINNGNVEVF
jgi:hypothetical protein